MCDISLEPCSLWNEKERKARTPKMCSACDGPIKPGDMYVKHFSKFEGEVTFNNLCKPCEVIRKEFAEAHDGMRPTPENLANMLFECEDEDDPEDSWSKLLKQMQARAVVRPSV